MDVKGLFLNYRKNRRFAKYFFAFHELKRSKLFKNEKDIYN